MTRDVRLAEINLASPAMESAKKRYAEQILRNVRTLFEENRSLPLDVCLAKSSHDMSDLLWAEAYIQNTKSIPK